MGLKRMMLLGERPKGLIGKISGIIMNLSHSKIYLWAIENLNIKHQSRVLDVGCGGGKAVKIFASSAKNGTVCGVDHSEEMVVMARRLNHHFIGSNRVQIRQASVLELPYRENCFDIITAFETIQFWPDVINGLKEVKRVMKPEGQLLIVNRFPKQDSKWYQLLKLKSADDYKKSLYQVGFAPIRLETRSKPGWIMIKASKPYHKIY